MQAETSCEIKLARDVTAPGMGRRSLEQWFASELDDDELDRAKLLGSELVTNAVRHGSGLITLRARLDPDKLLVEVIDQGSGFERDLAQSDFEQVGKRGLGIVDAEASRWGVHEGTTHVWFELERPGPRLGPSAKPTQ